MRERALSFDMAAKGSHRGVARAGGCCRFAGPARVAAAIKGVLRLAQGRAGESAQPATMFVEDEEKV